VGGVVPGILKPIQTPQVWKVSAFPIEDVALESLKHPYVLEEDMLKDLQNKHPIA
jgi:hypothetical protein